MSKLFISHSSHNNAEAIALRDWMAREGFGEVFLDIDPKRGIAAGERWERALHEAANRCEAVLFLVSRGWLDSGWCLKEFALAHKLNKRLFGVLIEDIALDALPVNLTSTWQLVNLAGGRDHLQLQVTLPFTQDEAHVTFSAEGLTRLRAGLHRAGLDPTVFPWPPQGDPKRAPYPGLRPLEAEDAGIFFGREAQTIEALDRMRALREAAPPRLLCILGSSGSGKSSFLRAGLWPRLARDESQFLPLPVLRPERAALTGKSGLLGVLEAACEAQKLGLARADIRAAIEGGAQTLHPLLLRIVEAAAVAPAEGEADTTVSRPLLVLPLDQGEELFLGEGAAEGGRLLALLRDLLIQDAPALAVVLTIRSDAFERLQLAPALEGIALQTMTFGPMPRGAYGTVIEGPAARMRAADRPLAVVPALTQALLADLEAGAGRDALPLLAFTLERLWRDYGGSGRLTLANYETLGRVRGSIEAGVEEALASADADPRLPRDREARLTLLRRGLIPWLAGIDPDTGSPRRRVARRSEIPDEAASLVGLLVEARLLATDTDPASGEATIEPAHEALLRQWGLLQGWLEEDFGALAALEGVRRAARDWEANAQERDWLAHGGDRLAEAEQFLERPDLTAQLGSSERSYLSACRIEAERKEIDERQRARQRRWLQWGSLAAALIFAVLSLIALWQSIEATASRHDAVAQKEEAQRQTALAKQRENEATASQQEAVTQKQEAERQANVARQREAEATASRQEALNQKHEAERQTAVAKQQESVAKFNQVSALSALSSLSLQTSPARAMKLALAAWPRNVKDSGPKLDVTPATLEAAILRLRERTDLRGHTDPMSSAVFSPDGSRVLTASDDNTARLWDAASGRGLAVLQGHTGAVSSAVFSPDGSRVLTASHDKTARLWDATGRVLVVFQGHTSTLSSAVFSPDGSRVLTASDDNTARLWDTATGRALAVLQGHTGAVSSAVFSPDGSRVLTASHDKTARLWDATGRVLVVFQGHTSTLSSAVFSPDGSRILTASWDMPPRLWDAATGRALADLQGYEGHFVNISSAVFSPDGSRILTASWDKTARLWDAATGRALAVLQGHTGAVSSAVFSPDGSRVLTASKDNTARLWDATGRVLVVFQGHTGSVSSAVFSPDGNRVLTASKDGTARLWDVAASQVLAVLRGHSSFVMSAVFSPDGSRVLTASFDDTARLWAAATGQVLAVLRGHTDSVRSAAFSPDGSRVLTASDDNTARLWDAATGRALAVLQGHTGAVSSAVFSPNGSRVLTASKDKAARLWETATGRARAVLQGHTGAVSSAVFSPDGSRVLTASDDSTARLWDAASGRGLAVLQGHTGAVSSAVFSPDGSRVLTASDDSTARLWETATGRALAVLQGHTGTLSSAVFSPDGSRVLTASSDNTARLWDVATARALGVLRGHTNSLSSAVFSPDGNRIVTASDDATSWLWDTATGRALAVLQVHPSSVSSAMSSPSRLSSAVFSPDGSRILTASWDDTARLWIASSIPPGNLFQVACAWLPDRDLSDIATEYGFMALEPICQGEAPLPDPPQQ